MFIPIGDDIQRRTIPAVPSVLVVANVLVFAYQSRLFMEAGDEMMEVCHQFMCTWGLVPSDLAEGRVMGLLSHMFVHGDFMHLLGNMIVLWTFACTLEAGMGSLMLLAFYMVWGLGAGAAHAGLDLASEMPLVGASGAIAGLMGAYTVAYGPQARIKALFFFFFRPFVIQIPAFAFGLGWIFMQMWHASNDPHGIGGIAWYAHIGGFALGALTMVCIRGETEKCLIRDKSGNLVFAERITEEKRQALAAAEAEPELPDHCPHCQTPITQANVLTPTLAKCGNADCERLVYPDRIAVCT